MFSIKAVKSRQTSSNIFFDGLWLQMFSIKAVKSHQISSIFFDGHYHGLVLRRFSKSF